MRGRLPLCALLVQAVNWRSGRNYPQALYFALHGHAAYFAILSITTLIGLIPLNALTNPLYVVRTVFLIAYTVMSFHTAYGGRWWSAAARTAFVLIAYINAITITNLGLMFLALKS